MASPDVVEDAGTRDFPPLLSRLALAGMLGLTCLGGVAAAPAPAPQVPQVVLLDVFPVHGEVTHGRMVQRVLEESLGSSTVEKMQVELGGDMDELEQGRPGALDRYVEGRFLTPVRETARRLEELAQRGQRYVIGQSQGASDSRVVEALWSRSQESPSFRQILIAQLDLPQAVSDHDLLTGLVARIDEIHGRPAVQQARQDLLGAVGHLAPGSVRVLSAGNQGELDRLLAREHVAVSGRFYRSEVADPQAVIVGAADTHGVRDHSQDEAAALASPDAGAVIGANGVDVPVLLDGHHQPASGSSFAEPQVTAAVEKLLRQHPELDRDQVVLRLTRAAHPVAGAEAKLGAGVLDEDWLLSGR